ncbi:MAG: ORF6N domain-containing protein [Bacteroidales bacterium]|nr:ORF6N domain-containing protein [Bacteroidales bacterium]
MELLTKFHIREIHSEFSKILDADVAELYGVENKRINESVSNKPEKFPNGYIWELSDNENNTLIQQPEHP